MFRHARVEAFGAAFLDMGQQLQNSMPLTNICPPCFIFKKR
jgi:hypothetical protein